MEKDDVELQLKELQPFLEGKKHEQITSIPAVDVPSFVEVVEAFKRQKYYKWMDQSLTNVEKEFISYFSGHGTQTPDKTGKEADELSEVLAFYNAKKKIASSGEKIIPMQGITDETVEDTVMHDLIISKYYPQTRVVLLTDCCQSGTMSNLSQLGQELQFSGQKQEHLTITTQNCTIFEKLIIIIMGGDNEELQLANIIPLLNGNIPAQITSIPAIGMPSQIEPHTVSCDWKYKNDTLKLDGTDSLYLDIVLREI
ncbi:MAG: hypothetical protein EZS28_021503 [Streblomastix strix]|uniref:Uncharacterized protein n=1 Tax=Streblomastix strix TaxID=222440 RepID=A0A5J4VKV0_9EUKA|nr:MAG: hypothetical protein EZS28_021503 [Streblomastix strix]